jgi:hypothetical protein
MKKQLLTFTLLLLAMPLLQAQYKIERSVIGSGTVSGSNSTHRFLGTVGQPVIGPVQNTLSLFGQGFWYRAVKSTKVERIPGATPSLIQLSEAYPNPVSSRANVSIQIPVSVPIVLTLSDALGKTAMHISEGILDPGRYQLSFDVSHLPAGMYFLKLQAGTQHAFRRLSVIK